LTTITAFDESNTQVRQVTRSYGLEGETLSVSGSTEPVTNTYDALYRVKTLSDGNSHTTTYAYNNIGLLSSITMPGSEVTQFTSYDNAGNLLQRIDGNSVTTNYVYNDAESFLTDIQYPASTSLNVHFGYDGYGRRASMSDGTGSQSYSYGNLDELLSTSTTYTGLAAKTISYAYYPNGSRQTMTTPAGNFSYSYDAGGRPATMTNPFSETTSWAYQNNNWLATQTLANGAVATYTHNALGQVTELLNQIGATTISDFNTIAYDGFGNRTSVTANIPGATSLSGTTGYAYDSKDQITQETSTRNGGFTDNFGYDSAGNPTSFKGITKSYNSNNQQTGTGFSHDGNGNPTNYGGTTLTFDPENRMTAYGSILTAGYMGDGLRAWKQNSSGRTYFLHDGLVVVIELDATGSATATNTFGAGGLSSRHSGSTSVFYSFDSEGNVAERSDSSGSVVLDHWFSAHGAILSGVSTDPFGYKAQFGYYTDNENGLQLLTHRYYDPSAGRFLTRDPISYSGGVNLFAYVRNNPLRFVDPIGNSTLQIGVGGGYILGPIAGVAGAGVAIDTSGNVGGYWEWGGGPAAGAGGFGGITFHGSNAETIADLRGPFANGSGAAGEGGAISIDGFWGESPHGSIVGGGVTLGLGGGGGGAATVTKTHVSEWFCVADLFKGSGSPPGPVPPDPRPLPPGAFPSDWGSSPSVPPRSSSAPPPVPQPAPTPLR
jgi:RHS repeat-associated protein